jgi:hypothetical protein
MYAWNKAGKGMAGMEARHQGFCSTSSTACHPPPPPGLPPAPAQDVARRIRRAFWARFTFNGITRYDQGAYGLVGGEEVGC